MSCKRTTTYLKFISIYLEPKRTATFANVLPQPFILFRKFCGKKIHQKTYKKARKAEKERKENKNLESIAMEWNFFNL